MNDSLHQAARQLRQHIHQFVAFSDEEWQERKLIGERSKKALDEKLLRIGQWRKSGRVFQDPVVSAKAAQSNRNRATENENNRKAIALIQALLGAKRTYLAIAHQLNLAGFKTARGHCFLATQMMRLAQRAKSEPVEKDSVDGWPMPPFSGLWPAIEPMPIFPDWQGFRVLVEKGGVAKRRFTRPKLSSYTRVLREPMAKH